MTANVVVDGVRYLPVDSARHSIGVAITTHNRHAVLAETIDAFERFSPEIPVIVVDDGSEAPVVDSRVTVIRHETARGIPVSKNRCLSELMRLGVEHLFLFDDDTRPADADWWKPYVDGAEPHYSYCWTHFAKNNQPVPRMDVVYEDDELIAYGWSMGCMLYVERRVVQRVGGMRPEFGMGMEEHGEWSTRIHNAGFTTFVHQDVPNASKLIWAADQYGAVPRSFDFRDRAALLARNEKIRLSFLDDDSFVEYRGHRNAVVTPYFTNHPDPQRGKRMPRDAKAIARLVDSCPDSIVVLHDGLTIDRENYCVPSPLPATQQRWIAQYRWLRDHTDVEFVWLVDATDVVMLNDPFPRMQRGTLYAGWENEIVGCPWIYEHSPNTREWVDANANQMLLNCGLIGGDRTVVLDVCRRMIDMLVSTRSQDPPEEMVFFNIIARQHYSANLITGRQVATVFKDYKDSDPTSWFAHK